MRPNPLLPSLLALSALLVVALPAAAQNQAALKKAFEGREEMVLMEMPASHQGVDLYLQREPEMEFGEYARRVKAYGVALRKEDRVMITTIKVNKKNIEIHLGGGGYGTWGDDSGTVSPTYVGKSKREQDLEKAKALIAESGVGPLELDLYTSSERPPAPKMAIAATNTTLKSLFINS